MPKNVKKFCRITKYLQQVDKGLYQVFDDLCLFSLFSKRGGRGITFLYPADKPYRKKIIDLAYSNTPEKAVEMIKALVLMDYLPSTSDFESKKDDIPNSLRKKLDVESADSKVVKLKGGFKLVVEKKYVKLYSTDNTAVYSLSGSGCLPTTGTVSSMKYTQQTRQSEARGAKGGFVGGAGNIKGTLENFVNEKYVSGSVHVYKMIVAIICKWAMTSDADVQKKVYSGLCASYKASYYNLVNPYSDKDPYKIGDVFTMLLNIVHEWDSLKEQNFNEAIDELIYKVDPNEKDTEEVVKKNIELQKQLINSCTNSMDFVTCVKKAYKNDDDLYKDLLTVYCYLATIKDVGDLFKDYHKNCFIPVMQTLFYDRAFLLHNSNDLANTLTLYGNLLKSDAFKYKPTTISKKPEYKNVYTDIGSALPSPTSKGVLITMQYNNLMITRGGATGDLSAFMGGMYKPEPEPESEHDNY